MTSLQVKFKSMDLKSPILTASGTSGHVTEFDQYADAQSIKDSLGAFVTKGITLNVKEGNPEVRIVETHAGILNSIGLQNKGAKYFVEDELKQLASFNLPVIVNISADNPEQFGELAAYISDNDENQTITAVEVNVSCPNLKKGGLAFGTEPAAVEQIVSIVKKSIDSRILVITKMTPNITDITLPARAAIEGGTDALSMINTLRGMAIDINTGKPLLGNTMGGLSGPAIKPIGLLMVYECFKAIEACKSREVPIIGIGGISNSADALEYLMAGASAVGVGTASFGNPDVFKNIYAGIAEHLKAKKLGSVEDLIGMAHQG